MRTYSPNYTRYSWPLAIAALLIILVGCLAPWLFTLPVTPDFTNTGEIGVTIGGTMSPFVGIAGVIMTFVAFMMQVRANEIQREKLTNSEAMLASAYCCIRRSFSILTDACPESFAKLMSVATSPKE